MDQRANYSKRQLTCCGLMNLSTRYREGTSVIFALATMSSPSKNEFYPRFMIPKLFVLIGRHGLIALLDQSNFVSTMIEKFQVLLPITTGKYELYNDRWCLKATSLCGLELLLNLFPTLTLDNLSFTSESLAKRKHPCKLPTLSHQFILLLRNISIKFTSSQSESSASNPALVK